MRIQFTLVFLLTGCLVLLFNACDKDDSSTIIQSGLDVETFESDKLNAFPIVGSMKTGSPNYPELDGRDVDPIWGLTEPYEIETNSSAGPGPRVTLKALYDNYYLFLLATWEDTSRSDEKDIWWFGSGESRDTTYAESEDYDWHKITETYTGQLARLSKVRVDTTVTPPDTQFVYNYSPVHLSGGEDALALLFNVSSKNFLNCSNLCHGNTMKTDAGELADLWMWGATRTDPKEYADDKYLTDAGFEDDSGDEIFDANEEDGLPGLQASTDPGANVPVLVDSNAIRFYPNLPWKGGNTIPGYIMHEPFGSKADITVKAVYRDGKWTLEMRRHLDTLMEDGSDIIFDPDVDSNVEFHLAVYDNNAGSDHAVSSQVHLLHFLQFNEE